MVATRQGRQKKNGRRAKLVHAPVRRLKLATIRPSYENDRLYRRIDSKDSEIIALVESIKEHGVLEPIVISTDRYILSGHRRHYATRLAGLKMIPCREEPISRKDNPHRYLIRLREYNRQRIKTLDEKLREEVVSADPDEAHHALIQHRQEKAQISGNGQIELRSTQDRCEISPAKKPMLNAVIDVLHALRRYAPVSVRKVHYDLLNDPPLRHASKPGSRYRNDKKSWRALVDLLARARLEGYVSWDAISDETRPVTTWRVHQDPQMFMRKEINDFLKGYWRDYQQSQPNHLELLVEKNTLLPILRPVAMQYCIPITAGRGYCSLPPRHAMAERYWDSGKDTLVLFIVSDFDPDGETIAESYARSMRDDFDVDIHAVKVALTFEQTQELDLPPALPAKETSSTYRAFEERYGSASWEVEALDPGTLQRLLRDAIDSTLDIDAFNAELDTEKQDAAYLQTVRGKTHAMLGDLAGDEPA